MILDVVYNHTAEGNHLGPTINFRGIDNAAYYRLLDGDLTLLQGLHRHRQQPQRAAPAHPAADHGLAALLGARDARRRLPLRPGRRRWPASCYDVDRLSAFFDLVQQDPVVSQVKLIAEPWDVGEGGYQVGNFPGLWTEWNGKYRDTVRDYWRGEPATLGEFASRLTGSSDLYEATGRRPSASINFVTAHDGFTLHDLVSYNEKHNEANGEDNRDGESHNRSWNCGVEGPTDDPEILALRARQMRNFLATLMLSQGTPMISHGDEIGRTQQGNNNVYCQDSELSWMDWSLCETNADLLDVHQEGDRAAQGPPGVPAAPVLRRASRSAPATQVRDIAWLTPAGEEMTAEDWDAASASASRCSSTARPSPNRTPAANASSTTRSCCASTPTTRTLDFVAAAGLTTPSSGRRHWTPPTRPATPTSWSVAGREDHAAGTLGDRAAQDRPDAHARSRSCLDLPAADCAADGAFTFADAEDLLDYLDDLGVSHTCTCRPILTAAEGSTHGYDVTDPTDRVRRTRRRRRPGPAVRGGPRARAWAWSSTSCPTTSASTIPQQNPWWWDRAAQRPRLGVRHVLRHRLVAGPDGRIVLPVLGSDDDVGRPDRRRRRAAARRPGAARSRPAPATAPGPRCTTGSTTG